MPFVDPTIDALKRLCEAHGGYKAVADKAKVSAENLSQILAGTLLPSGNPRGIGARLKVKLTKAYPGWLVTQQSAEAWQTESESLLSGADGRQYTTQSPALTLIDLENNPDYPSIRRARFKLSAGASGFAVEYEQGDGAPMVFGKAWYAKRGLTPDKLFAVQVANGSMEPGLHHGDTVVVNTEATEPKDGSVFAVNYEGELCIKRLIRDAGQWWLSSDNNDQRRYPRKVCGEGVFLIGEIVHKQSERI